MMYLKKLKVRKRLDNINKKRIIVSSDFETIVIKDIHYVYAIGVMYKIKKKEIFKHFFMPTDIDVDYIERFSNETIREYIHFLLNLNKKKKICIYFHNLRNFDGFFIIRAINIMLLYSEIYDKDLYKKDILMKDGGVYFIKLNNLIFLDSLNILNNKLSSISELFLKEKKKKFDFNKIKSVNDTKIYFSEILDYLYMDVWLLYNIIISISNRFLELYNIDIVKHFTISNISLTIYRKYYLNEEWEIEITKSNKYHYIKKSYFGGLCNLHQTHMDKGYYYDVNSLYPYVMQTCEMPLGKGKFITKNISNDITDVFGFIECMIYVPTDLPIPPLLLRKDSFILQPNGYLKGVWFSEEIKYAISLGCRLEKIYSILKYYKKGIIFKEFVNDLYEKKKNNEHNKIDRYLYKTIMNSLYGRLGIKKNFSHSIWNTTILDDKLEYIGKFQKIINNSIILFELNQELYENVKKTDVLSRSQKKELLRYYFIRIKKKKT